MAKPAADLLRAAKCVIFDFDGVLLESESIKEDGFRYLFRERPECRAAVDDYLLNNPSIPRTIRIPGLYELVYGQEPSPSTYRKLSDAFSAFVYERVRECVEVPGARSLLESLVGRVPLYVSSATPEPELRALCDDRNFTEFFKGVFGAPVTKPEHIAQICEVEKIKPKQSLFIGDSPADKRAADTAGVNFLLRRSNVDTDHLACLRVRDFAELVGSVQCN